MKNVAAFSCCLFASVCSVIYACTNQDSEYREKHVLRAGPKVNYQVNYYIFLNFLKGKKGKSSFERGDTVGKYIFKSILNRYLLRTHLYLVGFAAMHGGKSFA